MKWGCFEWKACAARFLYSSNKKNFEGFCGDEYSSYDKVSFSVLVPSRKGFDIFRNSGINAVGTSSRSTAMISGVSFEEFFTTSYIDTSDLAGVLSSLWALANSFAAAGVANSAYFIKLFSFLCHI